MSREIKVILWCDGPHDAGRYQAEGSFTVALGDKAPKSVDLCNVCRQRFIDPVAEMLDKYGVTPEKTSKAKRPEAVPECPDCGFQSRSRGGLGQHLKVRHGKGLRDAGLAVG